MSRRYGPHRVADAPTTHTITYPRTAAVEAPVPPALRDQRRQINDRAHASAATTLAEAIKLEHIRRERAASEAAPVTLPNCCGAGWQVLPHGGRSSWLFACARCGRTLAILDGTYEEVIDRI